MDTTKAKRIVPGLGPTPGTIPFTLCSSLFVFSRNYADATHRLKTFVEKAARATLTGEVFDDAATGQGLLNYFLTGLNCGALSEEQVLATGLSIEEIQMRSFLKILEGRRG